MYKDLLIPKNVNNVNYSQTRSYFVVQIQSEASNNYSTKSKRTLINNLEYLD